LCSSDNWPNQVLGKNERYVESFEQRSKAVNGDCRHISEIIYSRRSPALARINLN
jgi:hypothetical protein